MHKRHTVTMFDRALYRASAVVTTLFKGSCSRLFCLLLTSYNQRIVTETQFYCVPYLDSPVVYCSLKQGHPKVRCYQDNPKARALRAVILTHCHGWLKTRGFIRDVSASAGLGGPNYSPSVWLEAGRK